MRANRRTTGAADGSIIAAVIVTQMPRYQPRPPRSVPGPMSMSRMRATRTSQVTSDAATSAAAMANDLRACVATAEGLDRTNDGNGIASDAYALQAKSRAWPFLPV